MHLIQFVIFFFFFGPQLINLISFQMAILAFVYNGLGKKDTAKQISAVSVGRL